MDWRHLTVLLLVLATSASAQLRRLPQILVGGKDISGFGILEFDPLDMSCNPGVAGGKCRVILAPGVFEGGSCIGNPSDYGNGNDFCNPADFGTNGVDMTATAKQENRVCSVSCSTDNDCTAYTSHVCWDGYCTPTVEGSWCFHTGDKVYVTGDGTRPVPQARLGQIALGGTGADSSFSYDGSDTSTGGHLCAANGGPADVCRGGTCSGTYPNGTCTLAANSNLLHMTDDSASVKGHVIKNFTTFTMTGGTLKIGSASQKLSGLLYIRAIGNITISGGTFDLQGAGPPGATSGACAPSNAGKAGMSTRFAGGAAGASGANAGSAGTNADNITVTPFEPFPWLIGSGGGACPVSGQTGAYGLQSGGVVPPQVGSWGGPGGGGGGCSGSCVGGTCGAGGAGGGMIRFETASTFTCTSATINVKGGNGASGGGAGGGGGGVHVVAGKLGTNSCTYQNTGGSSGGSPPTGCGNGAAGGNGQNLFEDVPL